MIKYDYDEVYETEVNGEKYCFRYVNPTTRDGGISFSGVADVWKKGTTNQFLVPYYVKADEIDTVYFKIIEGIEKFVNG